MNARDAATGFGWVSIANHRLIAAAVIGLLASGLVIDALGDGALRTTIHAALALGTVLLAASGVVMSLFSGHDVALWDLVTVPAQGEVAWLAGPAHAIHVWGGWVMIALVAGHALAALKHHWGDGDTTLTRMTRSAA